MRAIGPIYPAHVIASQAEVRLVADQTANATMETIRSDQIPIEAAQQMEREQAKALSMGFVNLFA
jgi:hypothetical protein